MATKNSIDDVLNIITDSLGNKLSAAVLFGSYAEGRADTYSDIDVLVVTNEEYTDWREKRRMEVVLRKKTSEVGPVSPKIMSVKELNSAIENYNPLLLNVMDSGRLLYDTGIFASIKERFERMRYEKVTRTPEGYWEVAV